MDLTGLERRALVGLEVRQDSGTPPRLVGYAAVFNSKSADLGGFHEIIRPGAFGRSLQTADVRALVNHDPTLILGRSTVGTLEVAEDDRGLKVAILPPETQTGRDVVESVRRGDLDAMSFGFRTVKDRWTFAASPTQPATRELLDVDLFDVSIVSFPAYPRTEVALRSLAEAQAAWTDPARRLEDAKRRLRLAELQAKLG